jgi:hypothetical protein
MWNITKNIVKKEGRLDVCIDNAGTLRGAKCLDYPADEFRIVSASFLPFLLLATDDTSIFQISPTTVSF